MDKEFFVKLTNDLYKLTVSFPQEEPIRIKIRQLGDEVLSDLITILSGDKEERLESAKRVEKTLGILDSMLDLASRQDWADKDDFKEVRKSYREIKEEIESFNKSKKRPQTTEKKKPKRTSLNDRQKKILDLLQKRGKMQVKQTLEELPVKVTRRTIRRDFKKLVNLDFVEKIGRANETRYKLKE